MSIIFAGTVLNEKQTNINCEYQVFIYNKDKEFKKWSNIRKTENFDYSFNINDDDISGVENKLEINNVNNEFIIIAFWKNGSRNEINNIPTEFTYIFYELNNNDIYINNILLRSSTLISKTNWNVQSSINFNDTIIIQNNNTNEIEYTYNNKIHYQNKINKICNEIIFPFMGVREILFSFNNSVFNKQNIYKPIDAGDIINKIKISDYFGNTFIDSKITKVYFNIIQNFNISPELPYKNNSISTINLNSGDINKIKLIKYRIFDKFYNNNISLLKITDFYNNFIIKQYITFFNGYINKEISFEKEFKMNIIIPILNIEIFKKHTKFNIEFKSDIIIENGEIKTIKWDILRNNPDINNNENYSLFYSTGNLNYNNINNWIYDFNNIKGELKIRVTITDNFNNIISDDLILNQYPNIDWSKRIIKKEFRLNIISKKFNLNKIIKSFNIITKTFKIKKNNYITKKIEIKINKIKFLKKGDY